MSAAALAELVAPVTLVGLAVASRRRRDSVILLAAAATLFVAVSPPVHDAAHRSVTGHMVQHLLIVVLAAPLVGSVLSSAPSRWRSIAPLHQLGRVAVRHRGAAVLAGCVHAVVVLGWHHPGPYDAAVDLWMVHALEHATLLATGAWWWAAVIHHLARAAVFAPVLSLFGVATSCAVLGVFLMFAPEPLYAQGGVGDQQVAGALMAGVAGAVYGGTALASIASAVGRLGTPARPRIPVGTRTTLMVSAVAAAMVALIGHGTQAETSAAVASVSPPDEVGRDLYRRDCAACHGVAGEGTFRGVPIDEVGTASVRYTLSTGRMPIDHPDSAVVRSTPAYDDDEIDALVSYTSTFVDGPELPELDLATADLAAGGTLYRLHCAACHGATGIGGAQALEGTAPSVLHASRDEVAAAMVAGPGGMPAFASTFGDADIAGVAAYVAMLQDPPTTGVAIPGGRVGEGLFAWVIGVGALLGALAWIGRRA